MHRGSADTLYNNIIIEFENDLRVTANHAKEQLAGYFTVDVPDLDQAIAWAVRCPSAQYGAIEIRPLRQDGGS